MKEKKLMIMAGGTGGHVFPGLAVAHYLQAQGWHIHWLGTADRMEAQLVPNAGIEIAFIQIAGLRGKGIKPLLLAPWHIFRAIKQARNIIKQYQPSVVLGMGGYVSGPGGIAAWLSGIPVVVHEQNGIAGLTNRLLSIIAKHTLQGFPSAFKQAETVGNPVREAMLSLPLPDQRWHNRQGKLRVLVVGGSQGARILNQALPKVAAALSDKVTIYHQVGKGALPEVSTGYQQYGVTDCKIVEFIDDMAQAYSWADIVICRSGALTVSEIAVVGVPAIFIPFMHKDRQQYWNAKQLEQAKAAIIIEQPDLQIEKLIQLLASFERTQLLQMANRARFVAINNATARVAKTIDALIH